MDVNGFDDLMIWWFIIDWWFVIEWTTPLSEMHPFLEKHSLEFHEIWHEYSSLNN